MKQHGSPSSFRDPFLINACFDEPFSETSGVLLDVADIEQNVIQLRDFIPTKTRFGGVQVDLVYLRVDHCIHQFPIGQQLRLRIGRRVELLSSLIA